ncbi:putative ubiquinol-cytochrome c reductase complex 11 kda protein [Violaceomyces palustris]|uniref:Ubiquinol-cytochrome c reductase complex 11 kDa protein n=1 Tax=Violaceomyces palustris TaxID=1673888 RepID=A0ACD0NU98_9BASI|nr:putative ubiquinol-cytochrome c reductase complex 11 kda protein [Violaceomyces palustris]
MRPSQVAHSGMPTGPKYMGWWGAMGGPAQKGIAQYTVSPFQQNAMKGALHGYIFYGYKRIMQQAPYFALPFAVGYGLIAWAKKKNAYYNSKAGHAELAHDE